MNIVEFAEDILGWKLLDYQKEYLNVCYEYILQNKQLCSSEEWMNIPYEYVEKDTKCDLCDNRSECEEYLLDCTHSSDTRRHVINGIGHICPKDIKHAPCAISCSGDFMIDDEPCTSCDMYRKLKNKEEEKNE